MGRGIVDVGTCPDCLGTGEATDAYRAFERFINDHFGKRLEDGEIEDVVLAVMWDTKLIAWARLVADDHGTCDELLEVDDSAFCEGKECGGCKEGQSPCESYKLWLAGMLMARAFRAEMMLRQKAPAAHERSPS